MCQPGQTGGSVTLPLNTAIRWRVYTEVSDTLLIGYRQQIKVLDSLTSAQKAQIDLQFRQMARLEGKAVADSLITAQYKQKEQDLNKLVKRARTSTTLTGIAGVALTVLAIILVK